MNIKIQGGGQGTYANAGSCFGVTTYLQHEDLQRMKEGEKIESFFDQERDVTSKEVGHKIDNNRAKLCNDDAKFYVIIVSPSEKELKSMGRTSEERTQAMKQYIRDDVMQAYADGFGKGLNKKDIMYFGKIHHERTGQNREDMHAHIIVSRKDMSNTKKLSPQTNHKTAGKGAVKSGFNRTEFFMMCEQRFDRSMSFQRDIKESFKYLNAMKNGTPKEIQEMTAKAVSMEKTMGKQADKAMVMDEGLSISKRLRL